MEAGAHEGEQWLATEAPPLAAKVLEAMAAAVEATRLLVAAVAAYQSGADRALAKIQRVRCAPTDKPSGRGLLRKVLAEVTAVASGDDLGMGTPMAEQFARVGQ